MGKKHYVYGDWSTEYRDSPWKPVEEPYEVVCRQITVNYTPYDGIRGVVTHWAWSPWGREKAVKVNTTEAYEAGLVPFPWFITHIHPHPNRTDWVERLEDAG